MALPQLIDFTYFTTHPVYLPLNDISGREILNGIITEYQSVYAKLILGDIEFNKFESDFSNGVPASQKWLKFLNGTTYTVNGKTVVWAGFKTLLKYFVYYQYQRENSTLTSEIGEIEASVLNAKRISVSNKACRVHNIGIDYYGEDWTYKFNKNKTFTLTNEYYRTILSEYANDSKFRIFSEFDKYKNTVYNYLYHNQSDFPDWYFTKLDYINTFGI